MSKTQRANAVNNQRHADSSPSPLSPRATIKSEGRSRAQFFSPARVVRSFLLFFFFPRRRRLSLAFLARDEAARLASADNLRTILRLLVAPTKGSRNPQEIFAGLLILSLSLPLPLSFFTSLSLPPLALLFSIASARSRERYFLETRTLCLPIRKAPEIPDSFSTSVSDS